MNEAKVFYGIYQIVLVITKGNERLKGIIPKRVILALISQKAKWPK